MTVKLLRFDDDALTEAIKEGIKQAMDSGTELTKIIESLQPILESDDIQNNPEAKAQLEQTIAKMQEQIDAGPPDTPQLTKIAEAIAKNVLDHLRARMQGTFKIVVEVPTDLGLETRIGKIQLKDFDDEDIP